MSADHDQPARFGMVPVTVLGDHRLSDGAKLTYTALAAFADGKTRIARPGWRALTELRGAGRRSVARHLAHLVACGHLRRLNRTAKTGSAAQCYRLVDLVDKSPVETVEIPSSSATGDQQGCHLVHLPVPLVTHTSATGDTPTERTERTEQPPAPPSSTDDDAVAANGSAKAAAIAAARARLHQVRQ